MVMISMSRAECEFCYDEDNKRYYDCSDCGFCRKFYHNGDRIVKRKNIITERDIVRV